MGKKNSRRASSGRTACLTLLAPGPPSRPTGLLEMLIQAMARMPHPHVVNAAAGALTEMLDAARALRPSTGQQGPAWPPAMPPGLCTSPSCLARRDPLPPAAFLPAAPHECHALFSADELCLAHMVLLLLLGEFLSLSVLRAAAAAAAGATISA